MKYSSLASVYDAFTDGFDYKKYLPKNSEIKTDSDFLALASKYKKAGGEPADIEKELAAFINGGLSAKKTNDAKNAQKAPSYVILPLILIRIVIIIQGALRDGVTTWMPSYISETYKLGSAVSILTGVVLPIFSILCFELTSFIYRKITCWLPRSPEPAASHSPHREPCRPPLRSRREKQGSPDNACR